MAHRHHNARIIATVPRKPGKYSAPVSAAEARRRFGLAYRCSMCQRPPAANRDPMASNGQKPRLFKVPIRPLTLPGGKGWRIAAEIRNKLHVVTEMTERILQLVGVRTPDLTAIVAMRLDYADHLIDIGANEGSHRYWPAVQPLPCIAGLYAPQRWAGLTGSPALRRTFDLERSNRLSPRLYPMYEPCRHLRCG